MYREVITVLRSVQNIHWTKWRISDCWTRRYV